jgi:hypothetical protein
MSGTSPLWRKLALALIAVLTTGALFSQEQSPHPAVPAQPAQRHLFFAGTVTELDEQHVTVSRSVAGRAPEERRFQITPKTKMNKSALKVKSRVTVRYQHMPDGDVALEIQIRPAPHGSKPA